MKYINFLIFFSDSIGLRLDIMGQMTPWCRIFQKSVKTLQMFYKGSSTKVLSLTIFYDSLHL